VSQEVICVMELVAYTDDRYITGGRGHVASGMSIWKSDMCIILFVLFLCCLFVALPEHVPV
jgi:hypothetical protein